MCSGTRCPCRSELDPLCSRLECRYDCNGDLDPTERAHVPIGQHNIITNDCFTMPLPLTGMGLSLNVAGGATWVVIFIDGHWRWLEEAHLEGLLKPEDQDFWFFVRHLRRGQTGSQRGHHTWVQMFGVMNACMTSFYVFNFSCCVFTVQQQLSNVESAQRFLLSASSATFFFLWFWKPGWKIRSHDALNWNWQSFSFFSGFLCRRQSTSSIYLFI